MFFGGWILHQASKEDTISQIERKPKDMQVFITIKHSSSQQFQFYYKVFDVFTVDWSEMSNLNTDRSEEEIQEYSVSPYKILISQYCFR